MHMMFCALGTWGTSWLEPDIQDLPAMVVGFGVF
jgi:hypothetical protein